MQPEAAVDELLLLVEERDSEVDGVPAAPKLGYMREVFMSRVGVIVLLIFVDMCQVSFLFTVLPSVRASRALALLCSAAFLLIDLRRARAGGCRS